MNIPPKINYPRKKSFESLRLQLQVTPLKIILMSYVKKSTNKYCGKDNYNK